MPRRLAKPPFDANACRARARARARDPIERAFCRLKDRRAIATGCDKTARNFLAGVCLAIVVTQWIG